MQLTEVLYDRAVPVDGYGNGFFRINGVAIDGPVLVTATGARSWVGTDDSAAITALVGEIDVVLVGTGSEIGRLPATFSSALEAAGLGVEPMSTPAACRTYNVLLAEGRRVAAALIPVTGE